MFVSLRISATGESHCASELHMWKRAEPTRWSRSIYHAFCKMLRPHGCSHCICYRLRKHSTEHACDRRPPAERLDTLENNIKDVILRLNLHFDELAALTSQLEGLQSTFHCQHVICEQLDVEDSSQQWKVRLAAPGT